mgnify:CR=1 FL=1
MNRFEGKLKTKAYTIFFLASCFYLYEFKTVSARILKLVKARFYIF